MHRRGGNNIYLIITMTLLLGSLFVAGYLYTNQVGEQNTQPRFEYDITKVISDDTQGSSDSGLGLSGYQDSYASASKTDPSIGESVTIYGTFDNKNLISPGDLTFYLKTGTTTLCSRTVPEGSISSCSVSQVRNTAGSKDYYVEVLGNDYGHVIVTWAPNDNSAPVAVNDVSSVNEDSSVNINVLANDYDPDGGTPSVTTITSSPSHGSASINADDTIRYIPNSNYYGSDSFSYRITDSEGASDTATVSITVNSVNDLPTADNDAYSTNEDTTLIVNAPGVLNGDSDVEGSVSAVLYSNPTDGSLSLSSNGGFTYTPDSNFAGTDSFRYRARDSNGALSNIATVTITVNSVQDAPVALDDSVSVNEDGSININVLSNDYDVDGDSLSVSSIMLNPENGIVSINADDTIKYTPNSNYYGSDSFVYQITDGNGNYGIATVTVTVNSQNDAPVAVNDVSSVNEDGSVDIDVLSNDSDVDGDTLSVSAITVAPSNGIASINADGTIKYTPNINFNGVDTFTYQVSDGNGGFDTATVTVTVNAVNDNPLAQDDSVTVNEDSSVDIDVLSNDSDADGDTLSVSVIFVSPSNGVAIINADGTVKYTPNIDFNGQDSFVYQISDGNGGFDTATVTVTVTSQNDAPVAVDDSDTVSEDGSVDINVLSNDSDVDGDTLSVSAITIVPSNGIATINADGTINYQPNADFNGVDTFTYQVSDGNGGFDTASVIVTVSAINDAPVAQNDEFSGDEDTTLSGDVSSNDVDIDSLSLTYSIITDVTTGSLTLNTDGTFSYVPVVDFYGEVTFVYRVTDGVLDDTATVTLTINAVNDAPIAQDDAFSGDEDTTLTGDISSNDVDIDSLSLSYSVVTDVTIGSLTLNTDGTFSYVPEADFNGEVTFVYQISDGELSDAATVTLTVNAVNDAPIAIDDSNTVSEDGSVDIDVLSNDSDADGDTLSVSAITVVPSNGIASINADGTINYAPNADFNGEDSFTYQVSDGNGEFDTAVVTIQVTGANDSPVGQDDTESVDEDGSVDIDVLFNDSDADGDTLSVSAITLAPSNGIASINADGTINYAPNANYNGMDTFTYEISDGNGGVATATVTITVNAVNDAPVVEDDVFDIDEDQVLSGNLLLNDSDVDGDSLTASVYALPANGELSLSGNGDFTYTPDVDFYGLDSFQYIASDGTVDVIGTVTINVVAVNDAPVAINDDFSMNEDTSISENVISNDYDVDSSELTVSLISGVEYGSLSLDSSGVFTYTAQPDYFGEVSFVYQLSDGSLTVQATVTITINNVNDLPVSYADSYTTDKNTNLIVNAANGVLNNDTDADNDDLTALLHSNPGNGVLSLAADGSFTYQPNAGFVGVDTFSYFANDGTGDSNVVTVTINVLDTGDDDDDDDDDDDNGNIPSEIPSNTDDIDVPVNTLMIIFSVFSLGFVTRLVNRKKYNA